MACLRPSPSGRRLSELLEDKQEPFFLDLHLLEKGCSGRLLDGYDTALCSGWPAPGGNDAASVLRRLTSKKKKKAAASSQGKKKKQQQQQPAAAAGSGLLRLLLSKILHGKAASRTPAALQCSESFKMVASSPSSKHLESVKLKADAEVASGDEGMEYSDSDDEKQLSPVSVLENPFERPPLHSQSMCSNVQGSPKNAMAIVRELLLEANYTPALLTQLLTKSEDLILKGAASWDSGLAGLDHENDDDDRYHHRRSPENLQEDDDETVAAGATTNTSTNWETHRDELFRVSALVMSEVPASRLDAADVQPERRDVGAEVEAAVLEALLHELVMDLGSC